MSREVAVEPAYRRHSPRLPPSSAANLREAKVNAGPQAPSGPRDQL